MLHVLWGAAGTGKTEMLKVLEQVMLRDCLGRIVFCAWMGVAASLLPHGLTMCGATGLTPMQFKQKTRFTAQCVDAQLTTFEKLCGPSEEVSMVVMDEMSTFGPVYLHHASTRFGQLMRAPSDCSFGGCLAL
jgi:hypothetical protein